MRPASTPDAYGAWVCCVFNWKTKETNSRGKWPRASSGASPFLGPKDDPLVLPAARENLTVGRKGDRPDPIAAIFSNVREHICNCRLRLSPMNLRLSPGDRA